MNDARNLAYGREPGYVLKLLAIARRTPDGRIEARVHPAFLNLSTTRAVRARIRGEGDRS